MKKRDWFIIVTGGALVPFCGLVLFAAGFSYPQCWAITTCLMAVWFHATYWASRDDADSLEHGRQMRSSIWRAIEKLNEK